MIRPDFRCIYIVEYLYIVPLKRGHASYKTEGLVLQEEVYFI